MKYWSVLVTVLVVLFCFSGVSSAHRVNVFAYVDVDAVQVECYFTRSQKVRHGTVLVTDISTGATLLEGTTDEQGLFRFRPEAEFLKTGHGMRILLKAGEGHQSDWEMSPEELATLSPSEQVANPPDTAQASREGQPLQTPAEKPEISAAPVLDTAELEALIGRVMDVKLAPIKQGLARQQESSPTVRDIVGGIGWILGLLGLVAYMKSRR